MIELLGFDEDGVEFRLTGFSAYQVAVLCGDHFGYKPTDPDDARINAVVHVTLSAEPLTDANCIHNIHAALGAVSTENPHGDQACLEIE